MIVGLEGGMGNQLFQLAFGLSLAKRRGEECFFTKHRLDHDPNGRVYELGHFAADVKIVEREEPPITQDTWYFNPDPQGNSFTGHWQSEKYFDEPIVRAATRLKDCYVPLIPRSPSCAIHVRRGDYLLPDRIAYHGNVGPDYYARAMNAIRAKEPWIHFYVFSDDPLWCQSNFPTATVVHDNPAHIDLWMMGLCDHAIIPNSTFGWWGAWLGDTTKDRIVIAPARWFACGLNSSDVVPERWLKFEN
jgi:Glycosyl transferase family 11